MSRSAASVLLADSRAAVTAEACAAAVIEVLPVAMRSMRAVMRARVGGGLSVPQFRCLNYIDRHAGASLGEVATFQGVTLATASAMVERLTQAGYIKTSVAPSDRRRLVLRSSPLGRRMLLSMRKAAHAEFARMLRKHAPGELTVLLQGLQLLKQTFKPESA